MDDQLGSRLRRRPGIVVLLVLPALLSSYAASAQTEAPAPALTLPGAAAPLPSAQLLEGWRATMSRTPLPKAGCFTSAYPSTEWEEVPCTIPLPRPYRPASGPRRLTVGGSGTDWFAKSATGTISKAIGSFDSITGVTNETDSNSGDANVFSLQVNTNHFKTSMCNNRPGCTGWQQFMFSTHIAFCTGPCLFMQYWLVDFGPDCPSPWQHSTNAGPNDCFQNSQAIPIPSQTIAGLADVILTGAAANGGNDTGTMSAGNPPIMYAVSNTDSVLNLALSWKEAEFNIFGDCCGHMAVFNPGSTLVVRLSVDEGATIAPTCVQTGLGLPGEANNLALVGTPAAVPATTLPAIVFTESNPSGTPASCAVSQGGAN